jgi:hypothetical protein
MTYPRPKVHEILDIIHKLKKVLDFFRGVPSKEYWLSAALVMFITGL